MIECILAVTKLAKIFPQGGMEIADINLHPNQKGKGSQTIERQSTVER